MRSVFRLSDGKYCDNEDSHPKDTSDEEMIQSANVMGRFGGVETDYTIMEVEDALPHLWKLVNGTLIQDNTLIAVTKAADLAIEIKAARVEQLRTKIRAHTATLKELCELIASQLET